MKPIPKLLILSAILIAGNLFSISNSYGQCPPPPAGSQDSSDPDNDDFDWDVEILISFDPNEIIGPEGYDTLHWVAAKDNMGYTINFENDPKMATAPAKNVYLFYPVTSKHDISTFRLGSYGFNGDVFTISANSQTGKAAQRRGDRPLISGPPRMRCGPFFFWRAEATRAA